MFQVYERDGDNEEVLLHEVQTATEAQAFVLRVKHEIRGPSAPARKLFIKRVADAADSNLWHKRELTKFITGQYKHVPWRDEDWAKTYHFCHVSTDDPSKVAYTASAQHGQEDRQTRMRPGKYLAMIGCPDVLYWASKYAVANEALEVKFAATEDEIERVYINGPTSCMSKSLRHYDGHIHPVRVYAAGDLQVAYLQTNDDDEKITARCIVWPAKKFYHRVFGDEGRLVPLLVAMGYTASYPTSCIDEAKSDTALRAPVAGSLVGARLLKIENKKGYGFIMPYLDGSQGVRRRRGHNDHFTIDRSQGLTEHNDHFTIGGDDYQADQLYGTIDEDYECCCICGDRIDDGDNYSDGNGDTFCGHCWEADHFRCYNCDEDVHIRNHPIEYNGDTWCNDCANEHLSDCPDCGETFDNDELEEGEDGDRYCESCIGQHRPDDDNEATPSPTVHDERQTELLTIDDATPSWALTFFRNRNV